MVGEVSIPEIDGYSDFLLIGEGMSATVWLAHQLEFERDVAVKILKPGFERGEARDRFEREKRISARLGTHPCVVSVYATGETKDGQPFLAMEYCAGGSLADRLEGGGSFTVQEVVEIGVRIASALQAAHERGIIHRDITPRNILLAEYGPALTDFGISRPSGGERTSTAQFLTPMHSAPEAFLSVEPTPQMDIYSLGSTMYTLVTGHPAFPMGDGESFTQYLIRVERDPLPPFDPADVPPALRGVIETAMAKDSADRFESASELQIALEQIGNSMDAGPLSASPRPRPAARRAPSPDPPVGIAGGDGFGPVAGPGSAERTREAADSSMTRIVGILGAESLLDDRTTMLDRSVGASKGLEPGDPSDVEAGDRTPPLARSASRRRRRIAVLVSTMLVLLIVAGVLVVAMSGGSTSTTSSPVATRLPASSTISTTTVSSATAVLKEKMDTDISYLCGEYWATSYNVPAATATGAPVVSYFVEAQNALLILSARISALQGQFPTYGSELREAGRLLNVVADSFKAYANIASAPGAGLTMAGTTASGAAQDAVSRRSDAISRLGQTLRQIGLPKSVAACRV